MTRFPNRRKNEGLAIGVIATLAIALFVMGGVVLYGRGGDDTPSKGAAASDLPTDAEVVEAMKKYFRTVEGVKSASIYKARKASGLFKPKKGSEPIKDTRIIIPSDERSVVGGTRSVCGYSATRTANGALDINVCQVLGPDGVQWTDPPGVKEAIKSEKPIWSFGD
jgi:hypothetical protein